MEIKGKRKAPNGMYKGNIQIKSPNGDFMKLVMVEPLTENTYRAWSNSSKVIGLEGWEFDDLMDGWVYIDLNKDEFQIFNW